MRSVVLAVLLVAGCNCGQPPVLPLIDAGDPDAGVVDPPIEPIGPRFDAGPLPDYAISTKGRVVWKRARALEQDLMKALELDAAEVCNELGRFSCVDFAHLVPLGGNDPFAKGQYVPARAPLVTTPIAIERVVSSACGRRVDLDTAGPALVFSDLDLASASVEESAANATLDALYDRFLQRDPNDEEREALLTLRDDASAREFAKMACQAVATTTEALFQ